MNVKNNFEKKKGIEKPPQIMHTVKEPMLAEKFKTFLESLVEIFDHVPQLINFTLNGDH